VLIRVKYTRKGERAMEEDQHWQKRFNFATLPYFSQYCEFIKIHLSAVVDFMFK
jgi:hypothetical protein